jgi:hypothetical protein
MFEEKISQNSGARENPVEEKVRNRRDFLKASAVALAGLSFGAMLTNTAAAQTVERTQVKNLQAMKSNLMLNASAKSVMPNGSLLGRGELLSRLNLNPSTPPDAWLAIFGCGSNAGALDIRDVRILMQKGVVKEDMLFEHQLKMLRRQ